MRRSHEIPVTRSPTPGWRTPTTWPPCSACCHPRGLAEGENGGDPGLGARRGLAEAHTSLALALENHDWDWSAAEREFNRAIELNPGYATAHQWYAQYLSAHLRMTKRWRK